MQGGRGAPKRALDDGEAGLDDTDDEALGFDEPAMLPPTMEEADPSQAEHPLQLGGCDTRALIERLYTAVCRTHPHLAGQLTKVLAEQDDNEIAYLLATPIALSERIEDAMDILREADKGAAEKAAADIAADQKAAADKTAAEKAAAEIAADEKAPAARAAAGKGADEKAVFEKAAADEDFAGWATAWRTAYKATFEHANDAEATADDAALKKAAADKAAAEKAAADKDTADKAVDDKDHVEQAAAGEAVAEKAAATRDDSGGNARLECGDWRPRGANAGTSGAGGGGPSN